ncbi:MAG: ABC transporter transmembrane domain-containing protein [Rhodospirillales bacterium]
MLVSLHADRLAHRRRLAAMALFFEHVLSLPVAYHSESHSGRVLKIMLSGVDSLFGVWLAFFREHLATFIAILVLLPLSLFLNWRLGLLLVVLIVIFAVLTVLVINRTEKAQGQVEVPLAAGDAGGRRPWQRAAHPQPCGWRRKRGRCPTPCAGCWRRGIRC